MTPKAAPRGVSSEHQSSNLRRIAVEPCPTLRKLASKLADTGFAQPESAGHFIGSFPQDNLLNPTRRAISLVRSARINRLTIRRSRSESVVSQSEKIDPESGCVGRRCCKVVFERIGPRRVTLG